jgi:hypothetical protein
MNNFFLIDRKTMVRFASKPIKETLAYRGGKE